MKNVFAILLVCLLVGLGRLAWQRHGTTGEETAESSTLSLRNISPQLTAHFSGEKALGHVKTIVSFGPRPPSSEGFAKTLDYLESTLEGWGWDCQRQSFRASTPEGPVGFTNLLARFEPGGASVDLTTSTPWLIGGHSDSKKLSRPFVGANDGGSSTGVMLELARVLALDPASAAAVELAFFDGEEAFRPSISPRDGLYGSKHYAFQLKQRKNLPGGAVILDIVGDPDYALLVSDAPEHYLATIEKVAARRAFDPPLRRSGIPIVDDHVPLQQRGIPCLHLIGDFSDMGYWHTPDDTLDKVDPEMLERVGRMTLDFLVEVPARASSGNRK